MFAGVTTLSIALDRVSGATFLGIDNLTLVPEPGTVLLLGWALFLSGRPRRGRTTPTSG